MRANRATYLRWGGLGIVALLLELSIALVAIGVVTRPTASAVAIQGPASPNPGPPSGQPPGPSPTARTSTTGPSARSDAAAAFYPPSGKVVLFGGLTSLTNSEVSNETWTWDGKTWTQLHPVNSPSARYGAGVAYDPVNQVLVLYGGNSNGRWATDTWTWNGTNWRQMSPQESPPGWVYSPMTYDATRKAVVLYVGAGLWPSNPVNQTWSWDGANWAQVPTSTDPNGFAINPGTIAYDAATSQTIFVGPTGTWVLDPDGWRRLTGGGAQITTNTRGLNAFAITDDVGRGVLVEVGPTGDTWTWNGSAWTAQNPALVPPERAGAALVYDQAVQRVLFFGGAIPSPGQGFTLSNDTWVWDGATWKQVAS